jgi:peptide-methionine (S)-S-oxide reductase
MSDGKTESIVLGGGCFWCLEASFNLIRGVESALPGYAGGHIQNPRYDEVVTGQTGHAEVVQVVFDPKLLSLTDVLDIFWAIHDPTTLNRQGNDVGTNYRSCIYFENESQEQVATESIKRVQLLWQDPIVTELKPLDTFYPAEPEHVHYFDEHPEKAYCQIVINPKLVSLRKKFADRIK